MPTTRAIPTIAKLLLAGAVGAAILVGAGPAAAAHTASKAPSGPCWEQVVNDWLPDGKVDNTYPIRCYSQAITHLNGYSDVAGYSSAVDDIRRAQRQAILDKKNGVTPGSTTGTNRTSTTPGGGPTGGGSSGGGSSGGGKGFFQRLADRLGPGNAESIPLPLLVLGGLALLLLLAALATWLARRIQARRVAPAPASAPRR
jgi:hypothetical protein